MSSETAAQRTYIHRAAERYSIGQKAEVHNAYSGMAEREAFACVLDDLSTGGARITTEHPFDTGDTVQVVVQLSAAGAHWKLYGSIVWKCKLCEEGMSYGICFASLPPKEEALLFKELSRFESRA